MPRSYNSTLSDGLTNADQHPTHMQRELNLDAGVAATARFMWTTGVTGGLGGNAANSVVMEILSIGHSIHFVGLSTLDDELVGSTLCTLKVRCEPRTQSIVSGTADHLYYQKVSRQWGIDPTDGTLLAYSGSNEDHTEKFADQGHGLLIAAPAILFYLKSEGQETVNASLSCSFHVTYRYRTIPFHQWKKLHNEQTSTVRLQ